VAYRAIGPVVYLIMIASRESQVRLWGILNFHQKHLSSAGGLHILIGDFKFRKVSTLPNGLDNGRI